ncbi:uncharacterized protein LOC109504220 [Harpegnathos saltator]|uniref:uncharacterized protein LOC109504220 n=1 Tax=Harpegnathos saltator TaxID=610380 RepID=UPI0009489AE1|nr:uncharacterized protein LOC109504220 [Harpegnathos saltator]
MPWKLGGNFEGVQPMCEASWKECATAVTNYLWFEIVSDVVDFLAKEGMTWALAIAIISTILFCAKSRRSKHVDNSIRSRQMLSKVGYKIHDLELKVNVLTYKVQYGTWPLPHEIYSLNPKKLQKIRMTLSNPLDRKSWIKHVLLSPSQSDMYAPRANVHGPSAAGLPDFFEARHERAAAHRTQRGNLSTDCSSIETSKSTSDQSVKYKN